jgi:cellobiose phosphorylase
MAKKKAKTKKNKKATKKAKSRPKPRKKNRSGASGRKSPKKKPVKKQKQKKRTPKVSKKEAMARLLLPLGRIKEIFRTRYGFFLYDGSEFVINTPETPSPWCNTLTNGDYGMIVSQSGCGMSFKGGIANRLTRWQQDINTENFGKFVYIRDNQTQEYWSATWKPVCKTPEFYEVRHGVGYTNISSRNNGIISSLIYYVAADEPLEVWQMRIKNTTDQERFLSIYSFLEWEFGKPTNNREYDKLFVDTSFNDELQAIFAKSPDSETAFHSVNYKVSTFTSGRDFFLGSYRSVANPRCVEKGMCFGEQGRYNDPAAALHMDIELPPNGEKELIFTLGKCSDAKQAEKLIKKYKNVKVVEEEFSRTGHRWTVRLNNYHITTPDEGANILTNKWFRYQAISAGLACFGSVYDPKGKVSFKDYIINGLTLLSINPKYYRDLLIACAEKQFEDGSIIDDWDPITQNGRRSESLEPPLWLVYAVCQYLKETKDFSILDEDVKFQDVPKESLFAHCVKALDRALESIGKKGLPPINPGDHIERLDASDNEAKGESVWLAEFMVYILNEFVTVCKLRKNRQLVIDYESRLKKLADKVKKTGFDEDRFIRAFSHTGRSIGISKGKNARLFLDAQVWAILADIVKEDEALELMKKVREVLYKEHGPIMLSPAYKEPQEDIGTLSRLPQGILENAGVSLEAACWAIWAETKLGRANDAWSIYTKLDPVDRSHKSDVYRLEPFVSCEFVDGPDAPTNGRARNAWYNRCGYWMFKIITEEILGIKPTYEGLVVSPCIPSRWRLFKVRRTFRNAYYTIEVINPRYVCQGITEITVDGKKQASNLIPDFGDDKRHHIRVTMGKAKI